MEMEMNQVLYGFRIREIRKSDELGGRGIIMEHVRTGARLFWLDNHEENKVFSVSFRTLPEDNTGVFHILEHSVLCGSERFPVREPFVELLKSSMNTFLNAMTFQDMTMFPVSSRNDQDLLNLTEVYLDAVFAPLCIREEKVFRQEGWHIETDEDGRPVYKGVVFNEMKGAMSDTDTLIDRQLTRQLFPDTGYGFNSGGDPECIPDLTWEKFREQYRRHYHPSNAWIYLDGEIPADRMLPLIASYLDRYDPLPQTDAFSLQKPISSEKTIRYELGPEEDEENHGYLTLGRLTGTWKNREENMARYVICDVLTGNNEAPLKRKALERNLAQDLSLTVDDTGYQSWIIIHAERVTDGREEEILRLLQEEGEEIRRNGISRDAAEASLNRIIYHLREEEEPKGIGRCIRCMSSWLYGGDPIGALESARLIRRIREMLADGTIDRLAEDMLLNREGIAVLHSLPSRTLGDEKRAAEADKLESITAGWTEKERESNRRMLDTLREWQNTPDPEEALQTLPVLTKEDAAVSPKWTETEERQISGVRTLFHRLNCNGVVHIRVYFRLTDLSLEDITRADFLASLMGRMPTSKHSAAELQEEIKRRTGSLGLIVSPLTAFGDSEACTPMLVGSVSALEENAEQAEELLAEVLTSTRLDDADRIREYVQQAELDARQRMVRAGHTVAARKALCGYSAEGAVRNALEGEPMIRFIYRFAEKPEEETAKLQELAARLIGGDLGRKRLTVSCTATEYRDLSALIAAFPEGTAAPEKTAYRTPVCRASGFRIPAQVGFSVQGYRLSECGLRFSGSMWLAAGIISLEILWNRVRVQGGAYGAAMNLDRNGNLFTYSFRDPTPDRTLEVNAELAGFIREFAENENRLDNYIISSLNELNPLLSPRDQGRTADIRWLTGYTRQDAERIRREVLNTTPAELAACAEWLRTFAEKGSTCIVAGSNILAGREGLETCDL